MGRIGRRGTEYPRTTINKVVSIITGYFLFYCSQSRRIGQRQYFLASHLQSLLRHMCPPQHLSPSTSTERTCKLKLSMDIYFG